MLPLDWKERLKKDTIDFFETKIPKHDYDIDIIYNGYPIRVDNNIPFEVINFVAKMLAPKCAKNPKDYIDFYDYIWSNKGESGKLIFSIITSKIIKKDPIFFLDYIKEKLVTEKNQHITNILLNKSVYPYLKNNNDQVHILIKWLQIENKVFISEIEKLMTKLMSNNHDLITVFFKKLEKNWMNASEKEVNVNIAFLKDLKKVDLEFYTNVYLKYKNTRNPAYIDILAHSIKIYHPVIEEMVGKWCMSGNIRVKKAGLYANKIVKKEKKKR